MRLEDIRLSDLDYQKLEGDLNACFDLVMGKVEDYSSPEKREEGKSDLILVLGASIKPLEARVIKTLDLIKNGISKNVLFSGGFGYEKLIYHEFTRKLLQRLRKRKKTMRSFDNALKTDDIRTNERYDLTLDDIQGILGIKINKNRLLHFSEAQMASIKLHKLIEHAPILGLNIFLERKSANTADNFVLSQKVINRNVAEKRLDKVKKVMVVTSPYHCARAKLTAEKYLDKGVEVLMCRSDYPADLEDDIVKLENEGYSRKEAERQVLLADKTYCDRIKGEAKSILAYVRNTVDQPIRDARLVDMVTSEQANYIANLMGIKIDKDFDNER